MMGIVLKLDYLKFITESPKNRRISIATLLGEAIDRISHEKSVSSLFD